jgi:hypothetical protein
MLLCLKVQFVKFQVLTAASMTVTAFWGIASCSLVEEDRRFRGAINRPDYERPVDRGSISSTGKRNFSSNLLCPDRLWGPPSLLSNEYRGPVPRSKAPRSVMLTAHSI